MQVDGLPQRCAKVSALFDDLVRISCTASVPNPVVDWRMFSSVFGWECGVERLPQTSLVSPLVASTSTFETIAPVAVFGALGKTTSRGCALRTHRRVPVALGGVSVLRPALADTARPGDGRDHFSSVAAPTHNDFTWEFHRSNTCHE